MNSKSHTMHRDHSNNHSTLQNINHCMELIGTQHAILFSTPVVVVTMDSTIMMQPLLDSLNQKTLLFIQGIIFHSKPTNNKWIYNLSPLVDLKNFAFQRVWTARIEPFPSHPIADLNVSDYIIAGFPYSRVDGIVFSFAQSDIIAMSHRTKTYHEYLVMNQRANEGIRFCLNSIRIRFFLDSSHGALDRKNQTRGNNAIRNTKTGLVLIPVVQQETTQTPLAFHSVLNHLPVHSSQSMDYVDWLTYWSHYLKSQIEKRNSEKTSLENIPFMTLQDVIRFQLYNALVPFLEMTSDRVVLNKDLKRFMKRVHFWKVTNIPKEAPLCTLTELRRNFLALPLRPTSRTLVTDHFFN